MLSRRPIWFQSVLVLSIALLASSLAFGQYRGRKYKAPPATSRIEVQVTKKFNGKPIPNAAVVFNPTKDGKDLGNLEVKTDPEGKAVDRYHSHGQHGSRAGHRQRLLHLRSGLSDRRAHQGDRDLDGAAAGADLRLRRQHRQGLPIASPECRSRSGPSLRSRILPHPLPCPSHST